MTAAALTIYTIGHSNHPAERFVALLRAAGIAALVDVRSVPFSRRWPQYRRNALAATLAAADIGYRWRGDALGGKPSDPALHRGVTPDYGLIAAAPPFHTAIGAVLREAAGRPTAIMCAEKAPGDCHRYHLIAPALVRGGAVVRHLLSDGTCAIHPATASGTLL